MLIGPRSCYLSSLTGKLRSFFYLLQMITAWIVKSSSVLKNLWVVTSFDFAFRLWTNVYFNKVTLWIIFSQLWFGIKQGVIVDWCEHVVSLKSSYSSCSFISLHDWLRSWVLSRMLSWFFCAFNILWASRFIGSFHFWLANFSAMSWFMSRFNFLFWGH